MKNSCIVVFTLIFLYCFTDNTIEETFKNASLWEVGTNKEIVSKAREDLLEKGLEALVWIYDNRIGEGMTSLEQRATDHVFLKSELSEEFILSKLQTEKNISKLKYLIYLCGTLKKESFIVHLEKMHGNDELLYLAITAFSKYDRLYSPALFKKAFKDAKILQKAQLINMAGSLKRDDLLNYLYSHSKKDPLLYYAFLNALMTFPLDVVMNLNSNLYPAVIDAFFRENDSGELKEIFLLFINDKKRSQKVKYYLERDF